MTVVELAEAAPGTGVGGVTVISPGLQTTVQDGPGRRGAWGVGVPPSGAFDSLSFLLASRAVGNDHGQAGLEFVVEGPTLRFDDRRIVCVTGAVEAAALDGRPMTPGVPVCTEPGSVLRVGRLAGTGMRGYLAVAGGIDVPVDLGSRSTFVLGGLGGLEGRALRADDRLPLGRTENCATPSDVSQDLPSIGHAWTLRVVPGPHGAPEYLTAEGAAELFAATWHVDHRADRTGVRLVGPRPGFSRADGGEAGMHPSNLHDSAYPVGGIMLSGGTPVIVGPDGPSLGGFVVPACVVAADLWKLGQLRPGDEVRLKPVTVETAARLDRDQVLRARGAHLPARVETTPRASAERARPWFAGRVEGLGQDVTIRPAGDRHLLVEAGPGELDLRTRVWIHLLHQGLVQDPVAHVAELVPGVRSLLVGVGEGTDPAGVAAAVAERAEHVGAPDGVVVPCREVVLPIAFDDHLARRAMELYERVRPAAPWSPDNVEFIRRANGLENRAEVFDIVRDATYLVLGLGDVYLGAPVAVPIDPRHRLVTTKYDPARMWTPENAVGIGGVYLCVYGMEGPGGYQLVGRTVPVWRTGIDRDESPWLLRHFDRLRFRPVSTEELEDLRADVRSGRIDLEATPSRFSLAEVEAITSEHATEIAALTTARRTAFDEEVARWNR